MDKARAGTARGTDMTACLTAARQGSREALGRLLELCRPYLMVVSKAEFDSALQAKGGASDMVQETFLEAQRDFTGFQGTTEAELLAWLRRILVNNLANFSRRYRGTDKRALDREISLDDPTPGQVVPREPGAVLPSPSRQAIAREQVEALQRAITRLPVDYRHVIQLHHQEGRTFEETGKVMGRSGEAVRKLWARAIDRLQNELEGMA